MSFVRLPRRVMVIGSPGAGKSTLSGQLAQVCGLTPVHLDDRYWQADWTPLDAAAWQAEIIQLTSKATWLIDGNYFPTLPERINRAQAIIFVDTPIVVCLFHVNYFGRSGDNYNGRSVSIILMKCYLALLSFFSDNSLLEVQKDSCDGSADLLLLLPSFYPQKILPNC